jgi:hypothetical protein
MIIKEFIKILQKLPDNAEISFDFHNTDDNADWYYFNFNDIKIEQITKEYLNLPESTSKKEVCIHFIS